jgi:hypothetical protein
MLNSKGAGIDAVLDFDVPDSLLVSWQLIELTAVFDSGVRVQLQ